MKTSKAKNRLKNGGMKFHPVPRLAVSCDSFASLSPHAVKLLFDFMSAYKGFNNGDLAMTWPDAERRHWKSRDTFNKALKELLDTGWIIKTRQGGRNCCNLFALSMFDIDDGVDKKSGFSKYDAGIKATTSPPGGWFRDPPRPGVTIVKSDEST